MATDRPAVRRAPPFVEQTMFIAFALEGISILLLSAFGGNPVAFVLLTGLVFFALREICSLFPATCADAYGRKFAAGNYGLLYYTAKGTAPLLVPVTSVMAASSGDWQTLFIAAAIMNLVAAFMARRPSTPSFACLRSAACSQRRAVVDRRPPRCLPQSLQR